MNARTYAAGAGLGLLGVALLVLGRRLAREPFTCGDETCTEAHP